MAVTIKLAGTQYSNFQDRVQLLTQQLLNQGYLVPRFKSSLQEFHGRHYELVARSEISISQMTTDLFHFHIFDLPLLQGLTV